MKYYKITFQYSESTYCSNIAHAESADDVKREYNKYSWYSVTDATEADVEAAKRRGMPIVEIPERDGALEAIVEKFEENTANHPEIMKAWRDGLTVITEAATEAARAYIAENLSGYDKKRISDTATRLAALDIYRSNDPERLKPIILNDPTLIINYLIDLYEEAIEK